MAGYKKRIVDTMLERKLAGKGAVLIEGPKWCGKTTTAEQMAGSVLYMSNPAYTEQYLMLADMDPQALLEGQTPRLIDEWQLAPKLWDAIRFEVDHRGQTGQFLLTGSAVPPSMDGIRHTGTGRFTCLRMRPMSLYESGESTGTVSLGELFQAPQQIAARNELTLEDITYLICRGGWPQASLLEGNIALDQAFDYYDAVVESDISRVDGIRRNPERVQRLMRSYARHQGGQATNESIRQDMLANDSQGLDVETVATYISALHKIFVVEDVAAWNPNLRSRTVTRSADTRYFVDPSIATAALGLGPLDLMADLNTCGLFFETLCMRDLRVYAESLDGSVYHYRDKNGLECDAVVHLRNGSYGLIEIKLGGDAALDAGARTLQKLRDKIDTTKMKEPAFLMVLVAAGPYAYRRPDGVYVVPIGCLKN